MSSSGRRPELLSTRPPRGLCHIIDDQRRQPSWANLELVVPWTNLALIFAVVYVVALAATFVPALRASRVRPAEALRYQ